MDLIAGAYGWSDERILSLTLRRLRQVTAAIQRRQWLDDLNRRRIETAKLRAVCTYIAATMQLAEGAHNPMLDAAVDLHLGTGTENPTTTTTTAAVPVPGGADPYARIPVGKLADAPVGVKVGQPAPVPAGLRLVPLEQLGALFGAGQ